MTTLLESMMDNKVDYFPLSDQKGSDTSIINTALLRQIAKKNPPVSIKEIEEAIQNHHLFLANGGAGGNWKTIVLKGLVLAIYDGNEPSVGKQANFEHFQLPDSLLLKKVALPFSNWCGSIAENMNATQADLSYALMTDAQLSRSDFSNAKLSHVDFSRSDLKYANFQNADCSGADFENANLTGANFRGARLLGAKFPGAILDSVIFFPH